jgi:hypothetical protein
MNVEHKVSFAPGRAPVSILIIPPAPAAPFFIDDTPEADVQALAPPGQLWGNDETRQIAQAALDATYPAWGFTVVIPEPPPPADVPAPDAPTPPPAPGA